jgi:transcriptional regulator GlxA family with amidase domain
MAKRTVALIIHDGVQALDLAGPLDVFAEANAFLQADETYDCVLISADTTAVRASNGILMIPHFSFAQASHRFDIALVAGGPSLPEAQPDGAMLDWLRNWGTLAGRYGSICTGTFVLATPGCSMDASRRLIGRTPRSLLQASLHAGWNMTVSMPAMVRWSHLPG